jgi:NAD-dependent SIR2 family protein deacetylase
MTVPTITTDILINHLRDTLENRDNKICFILGAGASVESGIDSGAMLARQWYSELSMFHSEQRIAEWKTEVHFEENNIPAFYSNLFRFRYEGHQDDGIHQINAMIRKNPEFAFPRCANGG